VKTLPLYIHLMKVGATWLEDAKFADPLLWSLKEIIPKPWETPELIGWNRGLSRLIQVVQTLDEFRDDLSKPWRLNPRRGMGMFRYYLAPAGVLDVRVIPEGWGLLEPGGEGFRARLVTGDDPLSLDLDPAFGHMSSYNYFEENRWLANALIEEQNANKKRSTQINAELPL